MNQYQSKSKWTFNFGDSGYSALLSELSSSQVCYILILTLLSVFSASGMLEFVRIMFYNVLFFKLKGMHQSASISMN